MGSSTLKTIGLFAIFLALVALIVTVSLKNNTPATGLSREEVTEIVQNYIKDNPQALIDSVASYQVNQQRAEELNAQKNIAANIEQLESDPASPVAGNTTADVTMVEFFDYSCGYCKKVFPYIYELMKEDKNLKVVFKEFPILGPNSFLASQAALAVNALHPEKYFEVHQALMNARLTSKEAILKIVSDAGLNADEISKAMESEEIQKIIETDKALANSIGIRGTPAFVINGELIPGAVSYEEMKQKIADARKRKAAGE